VNHGAHTPPGEVVMGASILTQVPISSESQEKNSAPDSSDNAGPACQARAKSTIPSIRMRLLHFENTFGETYHSEYCLDAMLNLVLLMTRSSKPDADRLARLTGRQSATASAERTLYA